MEPDDLSANLHWLTMNLCRIRHDTNALQDVFNRCERNRQSLRSRMLMLSTRLSQTFRLDRIMQE